MSLDAECHTHLRILVPPRPWLQHFTPPTTPTYSSHHQSIQNPEPLSARQDMNRHTCPKSNWWCYPIIGIADHFRFLSNYMRKNLQIKRRSNFTPYFTVNFSFTLFWNKSHGVHFWNQFQPLLRQSMATFELQLQLILLLTKAFKPRASLCKARIEPSYSPKSNWCDPSVGIIDHFRVLSNYLRKTKT